MMIHFEGNVEAKHSVAFPRLVLHCVWPFQLWNLIVACIDNRPYIGLASYALLGCIICLLCAMKEEILFYKLYRIIKELRKC